jgi:hypothetical protein
VSHVFKVQTHPLDTDEQVLISTRSPIPLKRKALFQETDKNTDNNITTTSKGIPIAKNNETFASTGHKASTNQYHHP